MSQVARIKEITDLWHDVPQLKVSEPELGPMSVKSRVEFDDESRESFEELKALVDLPTEYEPLTDEDVVLGDARTADAETFMFRQEAYAKLLKELVAMGDGTPITRAIILVATMPREYRGAVAKNLADLLLERGRYARVRETILMCAPDGAVMLALKLFQATRDAKVLRLARVLAEHADRPADDVSNDAADRRCLHAKHLAALWRFGGDQADLDAARARCAELPTRERVIAWLHIARQTGQPRDFASAFDAAMMETDAAECADLANRAVNGVVSVIMPYTRRPDGDMIVVQVASMIDRRWSGELLRRVADMKSSLRPNARLS